MHTFFIEKIEAEAPYSQTGNRQKGCSSDAETPILPFAKSRLPLLDAVVFMHKSCFPDIKKKKKKHPDYLLRVSVCICFGLRVQD